MMRYLELFSLLIFSGRAVNGPPGSTELVGADIGPMLVLAPRDGYQDMVLGFEIISADDDGSSANQYELVRRAILAGVRAQCAALSGGSGRSDRRPVLSAGRNRSIAAGKRASPRSMFGVLAAKPSSVPTGPSGIDRDHRDQTNRATIASKSGDRLADLFAINLFDRGESDIAAAASVESGYEAVRSCRPEVWKSEGVLALGIDGDAGPAGRRMVGLRETSCLSACCLSF